MIFGLVYSTTVAVFPKGIFVLAASIVLVSLVLLVFVRPHLVVDEHLRQQKQKAKAAVALVGGRSGKGSRKEVERGRPRTSKLLSDSSRHTCIESGPSALGSGPVDESREGTRSDV